MLVMIPISLNGVGIQEGSYIFYLEQIGVGGPIALIVAVLVRLSLLIFSLIGAILFLVHGRQTQPNTGIGKRYTSSQILPLRR